MGSLEKLYDISPIFLQSTMVSISGYLRNKNRYGKTYYYFRRFLRDFDNWSLENKLEYQQNELISFIKYAYEKSPFYRELYKNIEMEKIQKIEDLKLLPIVDKETLRRNINDIIAIDKANGEEWHTGGTTGKSLVVLGEKNDMMKRMAILDHFKSRVGFENLVMKRATFNGKHIIPPHQKKNVYWRYNKASKQMIYSSFHLSEKNMKFYIESLNKYKPDAIDGFFMCMVDLASYIQRHKIELKFIPKAIFPTSETITNEGRMLIEKVFNTKVYDQYASSEGAPFVTECQYQNLHIEMSSGVFERYDENTNEVLVTSFTTHGTPLIRYRIGDSMKFDESTRSCACGNASPMVINIEGRTLDYLLTATGARINGGNVANLFKNMPNSLIKAQAIQNKIGEVIILLVVDKEMYKNEYDAMLINEFNHKFGSDTNVVINHVNEIVRESSGKFKLIKNNVVKKTD